MRLSLLFSPRVCRQARTINKLSEVWPRPIHHLYRDEIDYHGIINYISYAGGKLGSRAGKSNKSMKEVGDQSLSSEQMLVQAHKWVANLPPGQDEADRRLLIQDQAEDLEELRRDILTGDPSKVYDRLRELGELESWWRRYQLLPHQLSKE